MGNGADFIKIYADYRWGAGEPSQATFLPDEIEAMVEAATSAGRYVVAHASTPEGMRRAILGGVETIEHGDGGSPEIFTLMKERGVALCPTLAAGDAIARYGGWKKGEDVEPIRMSDKRTSFKQALDAGVTIIFGGDVGVFSHGENYREMELMVDYGMSPLEVLKSATSINAKVFHLSHLGKLEKNYLADIIAVPGDPTKNITALRDVKIVVKNGVVYKKDIPH
jgi:imidazolonepropionase-like amidohydrolase